MLSVNGRISRDVLRLNTMWLKWPKLTTKKLFNWQISKRRKVLIEVMYGLNKERLWEDNELEGKKGMGFYSKNRSSKSKHRYQLVVKLKAICNVMVTGPTDHGLHVIFFVSAMSSSSYHIIIATTLLHWHHTTAYTCHFYHPHILKQSHYEACRSNCEVGRSNPSRDLAGVTNSELTARTVKALEDFF